MNYAHKSLDDCQEMLLHPDTVPGLGDTGAHLGFLSDPTSPSYLLTHWHRDRTSGPRFPLELAVKLHSKDTADVFGLADRGSLEEGLLADVNVIDLAALEIHCPRFVRDLPMGAARWIQEVSGYELTIKSGVVTFLRGVPTGELPGRLVRGRYQAAAAPGASVLGKLKMAVVQMKWEGEQAVLEALLATVGPERLEKIGAFLNERWPLASAKM
jgi:N-acyl-D-amino-acid deacylase